MKLTTGIAWKGHRRRDGAAAVEMAIVLPVLTLLLFVALDYARIFYYYVQVTNCARNAAIWAADPLANPNNVNNQNVPTQSPYSSVQQAGQADWPSSVTPLPTVDNPVPGTDAEGNTYYSVTVTWPFNTITGYFGLGPQTVTSTARMRSLPLTQN
jgi:Flp pilus assembly protein TadG